MLQSLTTTTADPHLSPLFLRLFTRPSPPPPLLISIPETNKQPSLELKRERGEKIVPCAKDRTFNVHVDVDVEEEDNMEMEMEKRLHQFNREVMRTGLLREWWRRRFHENAREKRMRKHREALLLRRKIRERQQKGSFKDNEESGVEDDEMWVFSDESFEQLIEDKEDSNPKLDSYFQDVDGEGTWHFLDGKSHA